MPILKAFSSKGSADFVIDHILNVFRPLSAEIKPPPNTFIPGQSPHRYLCGVPLNFLYAPGL